MNKNCVERLVKKVIKIEFQSDFFLPGFFELGVSVELMNINSIHIFCPFFSRLWSELCINISQKAIRIAHSIFSLSRILEHEIDAKFNSCQSKSYEKSKKISQSKSMANMGSNTIFEIIWSKKSPQKHHRPPFINKYARVNCTIIKWLNHVVMLIHQIFTISARYRALWWNRVQELFKAINIICSTKTPLITLTGWNFNEKRW